jgi:hypothetical protein
VISPSGRNDKKTFSLLWKSTNLGEEPFLFAFTKGFPKKKGIQKNHKKNKIVL